MSKLAALTAISGLVVAGWLAATVFASETAEATAPSRADRIVKSEAEWRKELSLEEFRILREKGTERAFTGDFWDDHEPGVYVCGACGLELFSADAKFDSGTGWPSFWQPVAGDRIDNHTDMAYGMLRTEVTCARCGGHLGHVFPDGPAPTGLRYCINGNALDKVVPEASPARPSAE